MIPSFIPNAGASVFNGAGFILPLADAGAGVVNTTLQRGTGTPTFTRATAAACRLSTGLWKLDVASGAARSHYLDTTPGSGVYTYGGYLSEPAATQLAVAPRDMTNAAWVAVNVTVAQTGTGIDGVVNACSRLTSGAIGGSVQQTLVAAASTRTYSCFITRVSGTGTITINQGATTLDVTASLVVNFPVLVQLPASVLNAAFGITFGASGDVILVDCNQFEAGGVATTPIPAAGTRNADSLTYPYTDPGQGTLYLEAFAPTNSVTLAQIDDGSGNNRVVQTRNGGANNPFIISGGVAQATLTQGAMSSTAIGKCAVSWATNNFASCFNGGAIVSDVSGSVPVSMTTVDIGCGAAATAQTKGTIKNMRIWQTRLANTDLQQMTA